MSGNLSSAMYTEKVNVAPISDLAIPICPDLITNCSFGAMPKSDNLNTLPQLSSSRQEIMSVLIRVVPTLLDSVFWAFINCKDRTSRSNAMFLNII